MPTPEEMVEKIQRALDAPTTSAQSKPGLRKRLEFFEAQIEKKAEAEDPVEGDADPTAGKKKAAKRKASKKGT